MRLADYIEYAGCINTFRLAAGSKDVVATALRWLFAVYVIHAGVKRLDRKTGPPCCRSTPVAAAKVFEPRYVCQSTAQTAAAGDRANAGGRCGIAQRSVCVDEPDELNIR